MLTVLRPSPELKKTNKQARGESELSLTLVIHAFFYPEVTLISHACLLLTEQLL